MERRETLAGGGLPAAPYGCGTALRERTLPSVCVSSAARPKDGSARLSAFHRGSRWAVVTSQLNSRPGFLGPDGSARPYEPPTGAKIVRVSTGVIRARLSQSSEHLTHRP
jgi:hypothetical protein